MNDHVNCLLLKKYYVMTCYVMILLSLNVNRLLKKHYDHVSCLLLKSCYVMMNHVRVTLFLHQKDRLIVLR